MANLQAANWSVAPLRELIRHIVLEYHDCFRLELPQLERSISESPSTRAILRAVHQALEATLEQEEEALFPAIRKCEEAADAGVDIPRHYASTVRTLIPTVTQNNERLAPFVHQILEQGAGAQQPDLLTNLADDVSRHTHLENDILFPRALKLLAGL